MKAKVWLYSGGKAAWHFVTLPQKESDLIKELFAPVKRGWGSVPVRVTIGETSWNTSIFPDKKAGAYLLPLKANVRKSEGVSEGDTIRFTVEMRV